jgi:hypothetical protein
MTHAANIGKLRVPPDISTTAAGSFRRDLDHIRFDHPVKSVLLTLPGIPCIDLAEVVKCGNDVPIIILVAANFWPSIIGIGPFKFLPRVTTQRYPKPGEVTYRP